MRKAGDVCFSEVYRDCGGNLLSKSQFMHLVLTFILVVSRLKPKKFSIDVNLAGL
jgi:hypothetical protein